MRLRGHKRGCHCVACSPATRAKGRKAKRRRVRGLGGRRSKRNPLSLAAHVGDLAGRLAARGFAVFLHPRLKTVSISGRPAVPYAEGLKIMQGMLERDERATRPRRYCSDEYPPHDPGGCPDCAVRENPGRRTNPKRRRALGPSRQYTPPVHYTPEELESALVADMEADIRAAIRDGTEQNRPELLAYAEKVQRELDARRKPNPVRRTTRRRSNPRWRDGYAAGTSCPAHSGEPHYYIKGVCGYCGGDQADDPGKIEPFGPLPPRDAPHRNPTWRKGPPSPHREPKTYAIQKRTPLDSFTIQHLNRWVLEHVPREEMVATRARMRRFVEEHPDVIDVGGWTWTQVRDHVMRQENPRDPWSKALQHVEPARSRREAQEYLRGLARQSGYVGGRVIGDGTTKPWAAQAFFEDEPGADWFPEGTRRVTLPPAIASRLRRRGRK